MLGRPKVISLFVRLPVCPSEITCPDIFSLPLAQSGSHTSLCLWVKGKQWPWTKLLGHSRIIRKVLVRIIYIISPWSSLAHTSHTGCLWSNGVQWHWMTSLGQESRSKPFSELIFIHQCRWVLKNSIKNEKK